MDFLLLPTLLMNVDRKTGKLTDESKEKTGETVDNDLDVAQVLRLELYLDVAKLALLGHS